MRQNLPVAFIAFLFKQLAEVSLQIAVDALK